MAPLIPAELIKKKRDGGALTQEEIEFFINGYTRGTLPDYQMSALLMAIVLKGMNATETHALTQAMLHSGEVLSFSEIPSAKVDKHSTGGVGDKTSLILAPIVAAAGLTVPMISGRGLGHTGGTLDKLESIPGFVTQVDLESFRTLLTQHGIGLIGQTPEICPADKKIYALRDVTGTVESLPLICASIMSKKLAAGIDALVLDVKFGSGAFMKTESDAEKLARALMEIGTQGGKRVIAFITNMGQPLGEFVGNAAEVEECISILRGGRSPLQEDTRSLSLDLAGAMLFVGGKAPSMAAGRALAEETLASGAALGKFEEICKAQGGNLTALPRAREREPVYSDQSGFIASMDCEGIGYAGIFLGAGRLKTSDVIEPTAGIRCLKKVGQSVQKGEPLFEIFGADRSKFAAAAKRLLQSVKIVDQPVPVIKVIAKVLS